MRLIFCDSKVSSTKAVLFLAYADYTLTHLMYTAWLVFLRSPCHLLFVVSITDVLTSANIWSLERYFTELLFILRH